MLLRRAGLLVAIVAAVAAVVDRGTTGGDEPTAGGCGNETMGLAYYACLYPFDLPDCDNVSGESSPGYSCHNEFSVFVRLINVDELRNRVCSVTSVKRDLVGLGGERRTRARDLVGLGGERRTRAGDKDGEW